MPVACAGLVFIRIKSDNESCGNIIVINVLIKSQLFTMRV